MNAMPEHRVRGQHSASFIHVGVITRGHVKVMDLRELLAVFGEVRLQISSEPGRKLRRAPHHLFGAGDGETRTKRILEPSILGAMPFSTESFAFEQRN